MKSETLCKRRFSRPKSKYILFIVFFTGIIFFIHQISYLKELNSEIVGKLITGSVRTSNYIVAGKVRSKWNEPKYSKLIRDKNGRTVSLRGTRNEDITKYLPNARDKFVCFSSKQEIDFIQINDDYCDCPLDGSDEPGTNACNNGTFYCEGSSLKFKEKIPSYKVNDGYCDCCDGSDEWAEILLLYIANVYRKYKLTVRMQHELEIEKNVWDPLNIFHITGDYKYAVIILNSPICLKHNLMLQLWEKAQVTITVDGGTHRWLNYLKEQGIDVLNGSYSKYVPTFISGDMDSSSPYTIHRLQDIGSKIIITPDQMFTDYTKALMQLDLYIKKENINLHGIFVIVENSGRFDHLLGNINTLYKADKIIQNIQIIQVASDSLTWLLKPGFHRIKIPDILLQENNWCGLLPIGAPVNQITTTGLKWNLDNTSMQFGGLVSTSNTYDKYPEVTINTDISLIWTMGIEPLMNTINDMENLSMNVY
uniref:thiamin pyrophosphokinase 1-like n=1 Tax=Vespula vulgaris TaxID=7454 RepID=UPI00223AD7D7|nr:thiamin pyrophosphokinase 1-like [Vespula vulgaris]